jgi:hypothetical protein
MNKRTTDSFLDSRGNPASDLRSPAYAAAFLHKTVGTLSTWRSRGIGPKHLKIGHSVFYLDEHLLEFRESCIRQTTAKTRPGFQPAAAVAFNDTSDDIDWFDDDGHDDER